MSATPEVTEAAEPPPAAVLAGTVAVPGRRWTAGSRRGFGWAFWVSAAVLGLIALAAVAPSLLAPHDPLATDLAAVLAPPSAEHVFGTDESGRDIASRLVHGARNAVLLGVGATAIAVGVGSVVGVIAGLGNRLLDGLLMRLTDVSLAFPELLLALLIIAVFGGGTLNVVLAIGIAGIPNYARLIRGQTLAVRRSGYVEAARGIGLNRRRIVTGHVLPNAIRPVIVLATIGIGTATLAGAGLSFLGLGVSPPTPEWGSMLSVSRNYLELAWWYGAFPGLAITALVISTTTMGRQLQARVEGRTG
ncbi:ABC transporter permease [Jiangella endophytica]|uniref:ABC transporter permease n=1 Tax=Jiangella endophytica TaxID=1623398 RepID=UPI000E353863|nr:ABC transporter permease [Jiangella endophytica]